MAHAKSRGMTHQASFALLFVALAGCSGEVLQNTSAGSTTSGTGGGTTTGQGGGGVGGASCPVLSEDAIDWKIVFPGGEVLSPSVPAPKTIGDKLDQVYEGEVVVVSPGQLTIDTCPPNADCAGTLVDIAVAPKASPFEIGIPLHTFVHAHLVSQVTGYPQGGQQPYRTLFLQIDNLATWAGFSNPTEAGSDLWFLASDDGVTQSEHQAGPFGVRYDKTCDAATPEGYYQTGELSFWDLTAPSAKITLQPGETQSIELKSSARPYLIRNVDSTIEFIEGAWSPAFLVARAQLLE